MLGGSLSVPRVLRRSSLPGLPPPVTCPCGECPVDIGEGHVFVTARSLSLLFCQFVP